jgi:hypothetical protein
MITIYKKGTKEVRAVIDPDDTSQQERGIMRTDIVTLGFKSPTPIHFAIGDYATVFGSHYQINRPVPFKQEAYRAIPYKLTLEGWQYDLIKTKFMALDALNRFTELKFSQRGRAIDFMNLLISNLERIYPGGGWALGDVVDSNYVTIDFDQDNCLEALGKFAERFETEYLFEGKRISLFKKQLVSGVTLEYGQGKALTSIAQDNQDNGENTTPITRLYVYGSNKNIGTNYRDGAKFLRMGDDLYIEKNADVLGVFEESIYFDDVYPRHEGIVTAVGTELEFSDANIDFNVNNYLLPGVKAMVTFNTGQLGGSSFEVHTFNALTNTFRINPITNETINLPTDVLKPAVGDKYVIVNIDMPLSYITNAEAELRQRGIAWLKENGPGKVVYPVGCNDLYFKREGIVPVLGQSYRLYSPLFDIDKQIRLVSYTRNLRKPHVFTIELADSVAVQSTFIKLINLI